MKRKNEPERMNEISSVRVPPWENEPAERRPARVRRWLAVAAVILFAGILVTREHWLRALGNWLVCQASVGSGDAILIDNVETNYVLFERAQRLEAQGLSSLVLVPVLDSETGDLPGAVANAFVNVMCGVSRLKNCTTFAAPEREPISLNVARRCAEELRARGVRSVILVTDGFRSRRAAEIYGQVLMPLGIKVYMQPVFGSRTPSNWFRSWHGIQETGLQFAKLWYYRLAVL
jgi:hypothetical protein